jgi:hypothetical protein
MTKRTLTTLTLSGLGKVTRLEQKARVSGSKSRGKARWKINPKHLKY